MPLISIIVPCFNEEKRLASLEITGFLRQYPDYHFVFVDDGSTDTTGSLLDQLKYLNKEQVSKLAFAKNRGKASAVREGFLFSLQKNRYSFIGYWDADLSTSLDELIRMTAIMINRELDFAFGSRMKKLNADIKRSGFRHLAGRLITTIIDSYYNLGIYDTQCGAKLFSASMTESISRELFVTNWLFDVEIFLRIRKFCPSAAGEEVSLLHWTSRPGSKINLLNAPGLLLEFIKLIRSYSAKPNSYG